MTIEDSVKLSFIFLESLIKTELSQNPKVLSEPEDVKKISSFSNCPWLFVKKPFIFAMFCLIFSSFGIFEFSIFSFISLSNIGFFVSFGVICGICIKRKLEVKINIVSKNDIEIPRFFRICFFNFTLNMRFPTLFGKHLALYNFFGVLSLLE